MKVILNEDVLNLGEEGDIREVTNGYGRNYLIPKNLAVPNTKANLAMLEQRRDVIERRKEVKRQAALSLKERLESEPLTMQRPAGDTGKLFGSITNAAVAEELEKAGIIIERKRIELPQHNLKMVGSYNVRIKLYDNESASLKLVLEGLNKDGDVIQSQTIEKNRKEAAAIESSEEQVEAAVKEKTSNEPEPAEAETEVEAKVETEVEAEPEVTADTEVKEEEPVAAETDAEGPKEAGGGISE